MMAKEIIENGLTNRLDEIWGCEATLYYPENMQVQQIVLEFMKIKKL